MLSRVVSASWRALAGVERLGALCVSELASAPHQTDASGGCQQQERHQGHCTSRGQRPFAPSHQRQFGRPLHASPAPRSQEITQAEAAEHERLSNALNKLVDEARRCMDQGEGELAEKLLDEGAAAIEMDGGKQSWAYIRLRLVQATMLSVLGNFEHVVRVCDDLKPHIRGSSEEADALPCANLRLACAHIALGDLEAAMQALTETLNQIQDESDEDGQRHPLYAETAFYCNLLQLYHADAPEDVKRLEGALLESFAALRAIAGDHGAATTSALLAHSKLLFHRIEDGANDVADMLFEQLTLLHRSMQENDESLALIAYQRGTWLYTTAQHERGREFIQDSLSTLDLAAAAASDASAEQAIQHQIMLNRHRVAVIDAVMLVEGEAPGAAVSGRTQATLSEVRAFYDELLGPDNAISAEALVGLALLGIADGYAADPGKKSQLVHNTTAGLRAMAHSLPGGAEHTLVVKLKGVCEKHLGTVLDLADKYEHSH